VSVAAVWVVVDLVVTVAEEEEGELVEVVWVV
jgi:hypothetical protein